MILADSSFRAPFRHAPRFPAALSASVHWPAVTEAAELPLPRHSGAALDIAASARALADLRHARRHNHRDAVHWVDALYRVYIGGLAAVAAIVAGTAAFGDQKLTAAETTALATRATPWLGLAFAAAAAIGLRSGGRGGPLTFQAATVQHELLAPVDRATVLRGPAFKLLRFTAFTGACTGAVVAATAVRRLPVNGWELVIAAAVAFSAAAVAAVSLALIVSGRRFGPVVANVVAAILVAWSAVDLAGQTETSPFTLLGRLAVAPLGFDGRSLLPVVLTLAAVPVALAGLAGTSIDDARRRAGLVAQLRFAVTLQDIRTVVLLRRQLAQETPRQRPWATMRRGGRTPPVWRRDWRCYLRFPVVRIARLGVLAAVAGLGLAATWNGVRPAFLLTALALYLAAYDAVEPLAQEVDHPSRWDAYPDDHGITLLWHLPAAMIVMLVVSAAAAAVSLVAVPLPVVLALAPYLLPFTALAATVGAALSTVMGSPDMSKMLAGPGADMMGFLLIVRLVLPPALVAATLAAMFRAGSTPEALDLEKMQNVLGYPVMATAFAIAYIRYRKPARI
jgi:hypothetical protein